MLSFQALSLESIPQPVRCRTACGTDPRLKGEDDEQGAAPGLFHATARCLAAGLYQFRWRDV